MFSPNSIDFRYSSTLTHQQQFFCFRYGPIFRTSLFGQPVVISTDPEFNGYLIQQEGKSVELWSGPLLNVFLKNSESRIPSIGHLHKYTRSVTLNHAGVDCIREKLIPQFEEMFGKTLHKWSTQTSVEVKQSATKVHC